MQPAPALAIVTRHALDRIAERCGRTMSTRGVQRILEDGHALLDYSSGAWLYAGRGFVLVVKEKSGRRVVLTALSPEMVEQTVVENCLKSVQNGRKSRTRNWRREVVRTAAWCSHMRRCVGDVMKTPPSVPPQVTTIPQHVVDVLAARERAEFEQGLAALDLPKAISPETAVIPMRSTVRTPEPRVELTLESACFCRETRLRLGISQQDLANRVGVLRATIKRIECAQLKSLPTSVASRLHGVLVSEAA